MARTRLLLSVVLLVCTWTQVTAQNSPPLFSLNVASVSIPERVEETNMTLYMVVATDADGDTISYYISPTSLNSDIFQVDSVSGDVSTQPGKVLDREVLASDDQPLTIFIRASDSNTHAVGDPQFTLHIYLQDINDKHPVITNLPQTVVVPEDKPLTSELYTVTATDDDIGANALVFYYLDTTTSMFSVGTQTGVVRLLEELDYDDLATRAHTITIVAEDQGDPALRDSRALTITATDVNDLDPVFDPPSYATSIYENITQGEVVVTVSALDGDRGVDDSVFYSLEDDGNSLIGGEVSFVIGNETGEISVNVTSLDRETHTSYTLTVKATEVNDSSKVATAEVSITILDINDNLPEFGEQTYTQNVSENLDIGRTVLTVSASDRDHGTNANFMYELEDLRNSSSSLPFSITSDGAISLTNSLDFEQTESYLFRVIAREDVGGANGSAVVRVYVDNENDLSPVFDPVEYNMTVPEGADAGAFIKRVLATDGDKGSFGELTYSLISGHFGDFNISTTADGGLVYTARTLNYEMRTSYTIIIQAEDTPEPGMDARTAATPAVLEVEVMNINDNPPEFDSDNLTISLQEESAAGTVVTVLVVTDGDGDDLTERTFLITSGNDLGNFTFDANSPNTIITMGQLDYDANPDLRNPELTVIVNDTDFTDEITINIVLVDINDNTPMFENDTYQFSMLEEVDLGYEVGTVVAVDADSGKLGEVFYTISDNEKFSINSSTGVIFTKGEVDREVESSYTVTITATDLDPDVTARRTETVQTDITVMDINDNDPKFSLDQYDFSIRENTATVEFSVTASDADVGTNGEITYQFVSGNTNNAFVITTGENSGEIARNASLILDREEVESYFILVMATDGGSMPRSATANISITILDENDEDPMFNRSAYAASIKEDATPNTFVLQVTATDADTLSNAMLEFSIDSVTEPTSPLGTFIIDATTGNIFTQGMFDREAFEGPYVLQVIVVDNGVDGGPRTGTTEVTVSLNDVNDNDPIFQPTTYSMTVLEELPAGQPVATVMATDMDAGSNKDLTFSITEVIALNIIANQTDVASHFSVNASNGEVTTATNLDYEFVQRYRITIEATDGGIEEGASTATITVTVSDVNDHTPQFSSDLYPLNISEATLRNTRFSLLEVTDLDSGENSRLTFSADITSPLAVDEDTGELVVTQTLDYETNTLYTFMVNVSDNGDQPRMSSTMISVMLEDVNDNPPVFENSSYSATIPEQDYTTANVVLTTVKATDKDSGVFGDVSYELLSGNSDLFSLNTNTGQVSVVTNVDFEALNPPLGATEIDMQLVIQARDGGSPAMTSSVTVTVTITDENDNSPMFQNTPYQAGVRENSAPGMEVLVVRATDLDGNRNGVIRYSISDTENFSIDEVTGIITTGTQNDSSTAELYDFETETFYSFDVNATDNGTTPQVTVVLVVVTIMDVNDNSPVITSIVPESLEVLESAVPFVLPFVITVDDRDTGANGEVDYQLSDDGGLFSVNSMGEISLEGELDREMVDEYNITLTVTDRGQPRLSAESYFIVVVTDANDNIPTFAQETYTAVLLESAPRNSTVATLQVQDRDLRFADGGDGSGDLDFNSIGAGSSDFILYPMFMGDGLWDLDVVTDVTFDYETGTRSYDLQIQARDSATPFFTGSTTLIVTILDVNDNAPEFSSPSYTLSAPENLPIGGEVGSVLATDPDGANNGIVSYDFANGTADVDLSTFSLHPTTGVLTLLVSLNFESGIESYDFSVVAMDSGSPAMSSNVSVRVNVQDINEFAPMFSEDQYSGSVAENQETSVFVLQVSANDSESQSAIVYGIVTGSTDDFQLDASTGVLSTRRALDREMFPQYVLTLEAVDSVGGSSRTSYTQVIVTVEDENDNTPTFPFASFSYLVPEGSPPNSALTPSVTADDPDQGSNGAIQYSLEPQTSASQPFTVDSSTGVVSLAPAGTLDREITSSYTFLLQAADQGTLSRTGSIQLMVTLIDVNDLPPTFDETSYSSTVFENSPPGVSVVLVSATDEDIMDTLVYDITAGDPEGQFSIDRMSGLISTGVVSLDRETQADYSLTVTVMDANSRMDEVEVIVTVGDRNDNQPLFSAPSYSSTHAESNPNDLVVATVTATDIDEGTNGQVIYSIVGGNSQDVFYIDSSSGEVIARQLELDFEAQQVHTLTIEATDQAMPPNLMQFSTAVLTVNVEDINDNRPMFSQAMYRATVIENTATGTVVAVISATDGDSGTNGEILYSFQTATSVFSISSTTGVVTVIGEVNFEMGQDHELSVEARDRGNPQRSNVVTLQVEILNEDDENPRFPISFYTADVDEDASPQTVVLTVVATDPDDVAGTGSLTYDIIPSSNVDGYFRIDTASGEISTARSLDREAVAVVNLQVVAIDTANRNGSATVQITIGDVNDNAPQFVSESYSASLRENSAVGTTIIPFFGGNSTRVEALDSDGPGLNSEVSYDKDGEDSNKFSVDKDTGIVTVAPGAVLDREVDDTLILIITAEDHGDPEMTSSVTMTITLLDENDNPPTFVPPFGYAVSVAENQGVGSVLHTAVAMDPDLLAGGEVSFRLTSTSPLSKLSSFAINSTSGDITLLESLDREEDPLITLRIIAQDSGVPTLAASTTVQITVTDVNDNKPQFSQDTYIATVTEQITVGALVVPVNAVDPDIGTNGQVVYSIAGNNIPFTVNADTGAVTTTAALDYESQTSHIITVEACDMGPQMNCSTAEVRVYVTDFNDEIPLFDFPTYRTDLCLSWPANDVFMHLTATDRDSGTNSQLTYSIQGSDLLSVKPESGRVFLTRSVATEEEGSEFTADITARDGGNPSLSSTTRVVVKLLNCSTNIFRFESPFFEISTNEFPGRSGDSDTIADDIRTIPGQSEVYFDPELSGNPFQLNFRFLVQNRSLLDRETRGFYTLPITSTDGVDTAYATITVTVMDLNDNVPQLQLPGLSFTVPENISDPIIVTTAVATDKDIGANAAIVYRFTTTNAYFAINETTGVVVTNVVLDREDIQEHELTIQATDGDLVSEAVTISVIVSDINDNPPMFSEDSYSVTVVENSPAGTNVLTVVATDDDEGTNADLSFSILGGDVAVFQLDSVTGAVTTTQSLDFESRSQYSLTVIAADDGAPLLSTVVEINITVEDFNDIIPMFLNPLTLASISEGVAVGTVLTDFNVTDEDSGPRGVAGVRFSIVAGNTDLFSVNEISGILKTEALLDRDVGPICQFLSIQATDSAGENSLSNVTEIEVCLIDENDNSPVFTQPSFSGEVREDEDLDQQLILRVQATDADSDTTTNGAVVYSLLENGGVFDISPSTGFLSLTATLDKETTPSYELVVAACDRGVEPLCVNTTISVVVLDVNDNRPEILNIPSSCISVLETGRCGDVVREIGDSVFTVNASDVDSGPNGAVIFQPLQGTDLFTLSPAGTITIASPLDFEEQQALQLFISARDQGVPLSLTSETAILCINLLDINDNPPTFSVDDSYSVSQDEGTVPSNRLIQILATDADTIAENAMTNYSISEGNTSIFRITEDTGELFLLEELDCETINSYTLTVLANNSLSPCPMSAEIMVVVTVMDINDNQPMFNQDMYEMTIMENIAVPTAVVTVGATDADKTSPNNDLLYRLELGSGPNPFHMDQNTGVLTVQNSLDTETHPDPYNLTVVVEDKGVPIRSSSATVVITVVDVNDQPPLFLQDTYSVAVSEDQSPSPLGISLPYSDTDTLQENRASQVAITMVTAYLPDGSTTSLGTGSALFSVDGNNTLQLIAGLDRETVTSYDITITVSNTKACDLPGGTGCSSTALVVVTVTDVNDNSPRFTTQSYSGEVSVTAPPGTSVLTVQATDNDSGNFGEVRYQLVDSLSGRFRIDTDTGVIFTRGLFENLDGQRLTLMVIAFDNLGNAISTSSVATVNLVVLNDFQRISILFSCGLNTILTAEDSIISILADVSGLNIRVESYIDYSSDISTNFIFHAIDPDTNKIVDFDEFFKRLQEGVGGLSNEAELISRLSNVCPVQKITAFANIEDYDYPDALDTQTIVIFVLCVILAVGAVTSLVLSIRQRWVALHDTRSKLLADVFYGSPGSTSLVENIQQENYQLEQLEMRGGNRQNPMFVQPYDNWQGVDASGPESTGDISSMNKDNPLYESQEIRMEMFADVSDEEEGDEADDAELLAAALKEDEEPEDNSVTAI